MRDCAFLSLVQQPYLQRLELHYDNTDPNLPVIGTSQYIVQEVFSSLPMNASFVGVGSLSVTDSVLGASSFTGDSAARTWSSTGVRYGAVGVGGSGSVTMSRCTHGALTGAGTGTFAESTMQGSLPFVASASETFTFAEPQPDTNYTVVPEQAVAVMGVGDVAYVENKTAAGFDISFGALQTTTVEFVVFRNI